MMNPSLILVRHVMGLLILTGALALTDRIVAFEPLAKQEISFVKKNGTVDVFVGGQNFTTLNYGTYAKTIVYPIFSPSKIAMTRNWPMDPGSVNESHDHAHHKSMWISHKINGVDFWSEKGGSIRTKTVTTKFNDRTDNAILTTSDWMQKGNQRRILSDQTVYWFGGDQKSRWIQCFVKFQATDGDVRFDDTKEGLFAIRTHPHLRLTAAATGGAAAVDHAFGNVINSEGITGKAVWGKRARWMLYFGRINDQPVSIAMFDHPTNLRHPTPWHARDYGLVAANPFGLHHFLGQEKGSGAYTLPSGESLELRYRVEFFDGIASPETIEEKYDQFASAKMLSPQPATSNEMKPGPATEDVRSPTTNGRLK
jgi:hypothetical protein